MAANATRPIEASDWRGLTISAQTSANATIPTIEARRTASIRRPSAPASSPPLPLPPRMTVGKTRSFETMVASAVASVISIAAPALVPPIRAAAATR